MRTRRTYEAVEQNNGRSIDLPSSIQIDIDIDGAKIALNLIKQLNKFVEKPLILTQFEGHRSTWSPSEGEVSGPIGQMTFSGIFKKFDPT